MGDSGWKIQDSWKKYGITSDRVLAYNRHIEEGSEQLWKPIDEQNVPQVTKFLITLLDQCLGESGMMLSFDVGTLKFNYRVAGIILHNGKILFQRTLDNKF